MQQPKLVPDAFLEEVASFNSIYPLQVLLMILWEESSGQTPKYIDAFDESVTFDIVSSTRGAVLRLLKEASVSWESAAGSIKSSVLGGYSEASQELILKHIKSHLNSMARETLKSSILDGKCTLVDFNWNLNVPIHLPTLFKKKW
jgi:hypothetical protein